MSRSDQYIGLNSRAYKLVNEGKKYSHTEEVVLKFPDKSIKKSKKRVYVPKVKTHTYQILDGAWSEAFLHLAEYAFPDGRIWREVVQCEPWSSGPMYFLALKDAISDTWIKGSLWTEREVLLADGLDPRQYGIKKRKLDIELEEALEILLSPSISA